MSGPHCILDMGFLVDSAATGVAMGLGVMFSDTAGKVVKLPTGSTVFTIGVAQDTIDSAKIATGKAVVGVRVHGVTRAVCSAAITVGTKVMVDSAGKFLPATSGNRSCGIALSPTSATGDWFNLLLTPSSETI